MLDRSHFLNAEECAEQVLQLITDKTRQTEWFTATLAQFQQLLPNWSVGQIRYALNKLKDKGVITSEKQEAQYFNQTHSYKLVKQ
jgi:DNA-binding PadR family transcriptional regulator